MSLPVCTAVKSSLDHIIYIFYTFLIKFYHLKDNKTVFAFPLRPTVLSLSHNVQIFGIKANLLLIEITLNGAKVRAPNHSCPSFNLPESGNSQDFPTLFLYVREGKFELIKRLGQVFFCLFGECDAFLKYQTTQYSSGIFPHRGG